MMLQMQLGWDGHAECPDLESLQCCQEARARCRDRALDREGVTLTTRGSGCFKHLVPALQQQELLLNEICSAVKNSRQHARSSQAARMKSGKSKVAAKPERGDALAWQRDRPRPHRAGRPRGSVPVYAGTSMAGGQ